MCGQVLGQAVVINACCLRCAIYIAHEESYFAWFGSLFKSGVLSCTETARKEPPVKVRALVGRRVGGVSGDHPKGTGTGPGAMRSKEIESKREVKDAPRRGGAVGTG